jgi:hypothetical protein
MTDATIPSRGRADQTVGPLDSRTLAERMARESRSAQGLPPTVQDIGTLSRVANLLEPRK